MTLASSGYISLGGSTANRSVNVELGNSPTASITYPSTATRTLTGVSSGALILPNSFWGKSSITVSLASLNGTYLGGFPYIDNEAYSTTLTFNTDGTWQFDGYAGGFTDGSWATPTTTGIGSSYWVRWTRTFWGGLAGNTASSSSGWQQLSTARAITVYTAGITGAQANYTVEISSDSGGSVVLTTATTEIYNSITPG